MATLGGKLLDLWGTVGALCRDLEMLLSSDAFAATVPPAASLAMALLHSRQQLHNSLDSWTRIMKGIWLASDMVVIFVGTQVCIYLREY